MTDDEIKNHVQDALDQREIDNQFQVTPIPSHVHNGTDSQPVDAANLVGTLPIEHGGTKNTTLTAHAVLLGEGANAVAFAIPGTSGQVLTSNGANSDPTFQAISINLSGFFGNGQDGDATISAGTTTLTQDMFYNNLTLATGAVLDNGGYRIFVAGTLTKNGTGKIVSNGNAGSGQTAGAARTTGTLWGGNAGVAGSGGGAGNSNGAGGNGSTATNGSNLTGTYNGNGRTGAVGADGGNGTNGNGGTGGVVGTAGTGTNVKNRFYDPWDLIKMFGNIADAVYQIKNTAQNGGSSGGGGGGSGAAFTATGGNGGAGGGGGSDAGNLLVAAYTIVNNGTGNFFEAIGGDGGIGADGASATGATPGNGGAGAGGAGGDSGSGGIVGLIYHTLTGATTHSVAAGTVGTGGNKGAVGAFTGLSPANSGNLGQAGEFITIQL